ncbi:DapH/DapD/GlmU-related protein [Actinokineospora cianjurensis]|uniref:Transferase family hexapeptide repeat protein n=1 Tax=Actinokineospora cianjurensis TaxID=585224 RepID=A0A421B283_9PSEU|nr:DapH/DapD/GlmU-related protein [Actinokineospora cianjurensis]RLK58546.1 transferase family hexapeptide repeat protein [Actinokineospora cianjurensis]
MPLVVEAGARISRLAVFVPVDATGQARPVVVGADAVIGAFAVVHGGTTLEQQARVEEHAIVGQPELGYAVGATYPGAGADTIVGESAVIRAGAILYADVRVGSGAVIGHRTLLRSKVRVGQESQLGHNLTVERASVIGSSVRCSPGSHITGSTVIADRVFLGAGVRTVNDKTLTWRDAHREPVLAPPRFDFGAKVGSGSTILAGVVIGEHALVGAGSTVTCDVAPGVVVYGNPARVHRQVTR